MGLKWFCVKVLNAAIKDNQQVVYRQDFDSTFFNEVYSHPTTHPLVENFRKTFFIDYVTGKAYRRVCECNLDIR